MQVTEAFPGVGDWEEFGKICEKAEAARERAVREATAKRNRIVDSIPHWTVCAPDRIKAAAEARYDGRVKAAEEQCEATCRAAEQQLFEALDQLEARTL